MTTWTRNGEKVIVAYWYEVGDHTMFERQDLLKTQWAMCGKTKWPVMFKVLLEMPADRSRAGEGRTPRTWPSSCGEVVGSKSSPNRSCD